MNDNPSPQEQRPKRRYFGMIALALFLLTTGIGTYYFSQMFQSDVSIKPRNYYKKLPDLTFTDSEGKPFGSADLKGKVWVADFIFTLCPGQCPILSHRFSEVQKILPNRKDLLLVSFSIDSGHDTPEVLTNYAHGYGADPARWIFLTGDEDKIHDLIINSFLLPISRTPEERVAVEGGFTHSSRFVLVDRDGYVRSYVEGLDEDAPKQVLAGVKDLLRE